MTIYEVLERMIIGPPFRSDEEQAAVLLIRQMRDMNVLGTMARFLDPATHECRAGEYWPDAGRCLVCQAPMTVRPHECSPVIRWSGNQWDPRGGGHYSKCRICGMEM